MRARLADLARRLLVGMLALATIAVLGACGGASGKGADDPLSVARRDAEDSRDGEVVGRWLLGELLLPGGEPARAKRARIALDALPAEEKRRLYAALGRAVDDEAHGRFGGAAAAHLDVVWASRTDVRPQAPLFAWFAANHLLRLRTSVQGLWERSRAVVEPLLDAPGAIGWRARGELVEWWSVDGLRTELAYAPASAGGVLDRSARRYGCVDKARMAGPFGHQAAGEARVRFAAERPGPWPPVFERDSLRQEPPRVLAVDRRGCQLRAIDAPSGGVFYVETYVDLSAERDVVVAVQGAFAVRVDDVEVLTRDPITWGVWPRFGARVRLAPGRHRILARVGGPETSIRLMTPSGTPLDVTPSDDPSPAYAMTPPEVLADPNVLEPFVTALGVAPQPGTPRGHDEGIAQDPIGRYVAAYLAHVDGQDDVAGVLLEPLVQEASRATGQALAAQALYLEKDPVLPAGDARDLAKDLRTRAGRKDGELWWPELWLALDAADKSGLPEAAPALERLATRYPEVPDILRGLVAIYGKLGWTAERARTVELAARRFPDDVDALVALLALHDERGQRAEADRLVERIRRLDPDAEVELERALVRRDWRAAVAELERLGQRRKDRKDIAARVADLLVRAGAARDSLERLELALRRDPSDAATRLALADARLAQGDGSALRRALVEAIRTGSDQGALREAIELVDGTSELSPYRVDGRRVIAEFERIGEKLPGQAARVLDYSAIWVHADGTARMLEHEIICVQSREAIQEHAEQRLPQGLALRMRTIKKDGRVLEPEAVEGKPTVTMPHLEVGDYIETETLVSLRGDAQAGRTFQGPRWFFREEKMAYWRSEFVVISPKNRPLDIEIGGTVPAPVVTEDGALVTRRWRVDKSPALPEEPGSAPIQEFLPNVRVGWGITQAEVVARMTDAAADETPRDPRLLRIARTIAAGDRGTPAATGPDERARRIYRWVVANVEVGRETDARRIVMGKSGNRTEAFRYLCRLLGIDVRLGIVRDRLTPPPRGPMSDAETFSSIAVRVATERGVRWMIVRDKFAPYGYLPSSLREQPAVVLSAGAPRETTTAQGPSDTVAHVGEVVLSPDGSAVVDLEQRFDGKFAIAVRTALETLPDARLRDWIETRILPQTLPGARLDRFEVKNLTELDAPVVLALRLELSSFARVRNGELTLAPPFALNLQAMAALPSRETPLYLSEQIATRSEVKLRIQLPKGARVVSDLGVVSARNESRSVEVRDRVEKGVLVLDRVVDVPAGRVQPDAYPAFQAFARKADAALHRDVVVTLQSP